MPNVFTDIQELDTALKDGWIILTPNHRTSVQINEIYGHYLKSQVNLGVMPSPEIYPIDIWLKQLNQQLVIELEKLEAYTILDSYQELSVWKKIIRESEISPLLLNLENTAPQILEAYRLMIQWQINSTSLKSYQNKIGADEQLDDCAAFIDWSEQYQQYCRKEKLGSFSEILQMMLQVLEHEQCALPNKIILLGFDKPPPLYQDLFELLQNKTQIKHFLWQKQRPKIQKFSYSDDVIEIKEVAKWSRETLANNPDARIGIISAQIHQQHSLFKNVFQTTFESYSQNNAPYFIASTNSFSQEFPILLELVELLNFNQVDLPTLELCRLLRSPLLLAQEEENARAALELNLRQNSQTLLRSAQLRSLLHQSDKAWFSPLLAKALQDCETLRRQQEFKQNINTWVVFFNKQLEFLVWPTEDLTTKNNFIIYCWQQVLSDFKALSFLYDKLSLNQALGIIKQLIQNFKYSKNRQEAPIQLLSPNDAAGLRFTHLWFLGLSDSEWPEQQYSNPYIPLALQDKFMLPGSSPKLAHKAATDTMLTLYTNTEEEFVLSHPLANQTGELLPTKLISILSPEVEIEFKASKENSFQLHPSISALFLNEEHDKLLETFTDKKTIDISEKEILKGGISLISNQSECPFKAFATHRLKAHELPEISYGIPAKDIGTMLHLVLESFWKNLKSQEAISKFSEDKIASMIEIASEIGIDFLRKKHAHLVQSNYAILEKRRLSKLLRKWLTQESLRAPFDVIEQERKVQWQHADLNLNFKIDRIDQSKGSFVLVDYKSGIGKSVITDDDRPSDPQLMLYADALRQEDKIKPINALLYAQVNIDSPSYHGISLDNDTFPKTAINEQRNLIHDFNWEELKQHWQSVLSNIAQEFLDGYIAVNPKSAKSCQFCHLDSFCRINEHDNQSVSLISAHD